MASLYVEFEGTEIEVPQDSTLTFGREAGLVVDGANRYLHRVLGAFTSLDSIWVLQNVGRHIPLLVIDRHGMSRADVAPGAQFGLTFEESAVCFEAGGVRYEVRAALSEAPPLAVETADPTDTIDVGVITLNDEQRRMVAALAEPFLRGDPRWPAPMPGNRQVASCLGWTLTKFNRKLDYLCSRLAHGGVEGLQGSAGTNATNRRQILVEHLVERGLVGLDDLDPSREERS